MKAIATWAILAGALAGNALADVVYLNNGDRVSGTVISADEGAIKLSTPSMGEVTIQMAEVSTFTTDNPVELHLDDGAVLKQAVVAGAGGQIGTGEGEAAGGQGIPLTSIKSINPTPPEKIKWSGSMTAGAIATRGNTNTEAANAALDAQRRSEEDRLTLNAAYNYSREKTEDEGARVTMENWLVAGKYDYFLTEKWYVYGNAKVERDHIANLDLRVTPGAGAGYQWIESEKTNFNTEAGLTWVYERYTDPDDTREHVAGRFAHHYDRQINENVKFVHNLEILPSLEDLGEFLLTADAGLRATLTKDFFGEVKVQLQHNSQPAQGKEKNDVRYMINVGWGF